MLAANRPDDASEYVDDEYVRENPDIEDTVISRMIDCEAFEFLAHEDNRISLNGADWSRFASALAGSENRTVSIVHIGDSHIQADLATGRARDLFQQRYGSAGRGLVVPLKLAGTNEPLDYSIVSASTFRAERLLNYPWSSPMGFTGVTLVPDGRSFDVTITAHEPFENINVYYGGGALSVESVEQSGEPLLYGSTDRSGCLEINLPYPCESVTLNMTGSVEIGIYGFELVSDIIGVAYHSIGINGATYGSYGRIGGFGESVAALAPDLIILSLGTNEAFGRISDDEFMSQVDMLVSDLQHGCPSTPILLVTPAECQRRVRSGRRRVFKVNANIARLRSVIVEYGRTHEVAVYDWYHVAGGSGSSAKWLAAKLLGRDRIHCTSAGYDVAGQMLYDAVTSSVEQIAEP